MTIAEMIAKVSRTDSPDPTDKLPEWGASVSAGLVDIPRRPKRTAGKPNYRFVLLVAPRPRHPSLASGDRIYQLSYPGPPNAVDRRPSPCSSRAKYLSKPRDISIWPTRVKGARRLQFTG